MTRYIVATSGTCKTCILRELREKGKCVAFRGDLFPSGCWAKGCFRLATDREIKAYRFKQVKNKYQSKGKSDNRID